MNNIFEGNWENIRSQVKKTWGKLTETDLNDIEEDQQEIYGKLQKHYGYSKEEVTKALQNFQSKNRH